MIRNVLLGVAAGLVAGPLVGLAEAVHILTSGSPAEYGALLYATLLYGLGGAVLGVVPGVGLALARLVFRRVADATAYTLSFLAVLCGLGAFITRHVVARGRFLEDGVREAPDPAVAFGFMAIFLLGLWLGPILLTRTPFKILLNRRGTLALFGALVLLSGVFSFSPARGGGGDGDLAPERVQGDHLAAAPNLLLVVADALRADQLADPPDLTRRLHLLAEESVIFEQAVAPSSWTRPSFATLFTSLPPGAHGCTTVDGALPDAAVTLAEALQGQGVVTGALPNSPHVTRSFNLQQGFDWFRYVPPRHALLATDTASQLTLHGLARRLLAGLLGRGSGVEEHHRPAAEVVEDALAFVEANRDRRWFLVVHLMEPHEPCFGPDGAVTFCRQGTAPAPGEASAIRAACAADLGAMDAAAGALLDGLHRLGVYDDTLLVFTADHGQEYGDHDGWWHGTTVYDELVHVPLLVKLPRQEGAGVRVPWQVRLMDVPPTLLEAVGAPVPEEWMGTSLLDAPTRALLEEARGRAEALAAVEDGMATAVAVAAGGAPEDMLPEPPAMPSWDVHPASRPALIQLDLAGNRLDAVRMGGWKLIRGREGSPRGLPATQLFDLVQDPLEQEDRAGEGLEIQGALDQALRRALDEVARHSLVRPAAEVDEATRQRMEQLGYVVEE